MIVVYLFVDLFICLLTYVFVYLFNDCVLSLCRELLVLFIIVLFGDCSLCLFVCLLALSVVLYIYIYI